ncbi:MAG: RsmB/NOP family class I SAM-dependent RNA methyltransferase [Lachnospiraceae bacterium]|nr:RsmB/NOP family class I SAM-dependent RNA methyltransferase [Lachnospiraceae bacterium]
MKLPESYINRITKQLGEEADAYFACFDEARYQGLRVNTLKISVEDFLKISPFELSHVEWTDNGFYYDADKYQPAKHPYYAAGLYYLQEPSAMSPAAMLPISEGDRVLDMCAAPGGKSTELGAKLNNTGILYSNDISQSRARALLKNIELFGISNSVVISEDPVKLIGKCKGYFDKILIDAPCSGEGMFRKENSIIRNWEQTGCEYYSDIQKNIIVTAAKLLREGGMMLYSTCTFSPLEDEESVLHLLKCCPYMEIVKLPIYEGFDTGHPEWVSDEYKNLDLPLEDLRLTRRLWPHRIKGEGHYVALLKKRLRSELDELNIDYDPDDYIESYGLYPYKGAKLSDEAREFFKSYDIDIDESRLELHDGRLYLAPKDMADVRGLRILRSGVYLGDEKKNRFEPSQPFIEAIGYFDKGSYVSLKADDIRIDKFLKGETISYEEALDKGYVAVTVDNYAVGWGKALNGNIKNKIPSGWR